MSTSRRVFFASAAATASAAVFQPGANDKLRLGILGFGGRGTYLLDEIRKANENAEVVAVCDVWKVARDRANAAVTKLYGRAPMLTSRYEEVLASKDVDAVLIAMPDFTHSRVLLDAIKAGKDAYCEKPMGTIWEDAKAAYLAVKASKQVVQVGTQRRSDPGLMACADLMKAGTLGKITRADLQVHFQEARWRRDYHQIRSEDIDWDAFRFHGYVKSGPDLRRYREWQLFREFTNGIPGLWMSHLIDLAPWFLNDPYPQSCVGIGGVYQWKDGRQTSDIYHALFEYKDCLVSFQMSLTNELYWRNHWFGMRGTLDADALTYSGKGSRQPDRLMQEFKVEKVPNIESHMANWLRCLRTRATPRADIQAGFSHAVAGIMATKAMEENRRVRFQADTLEIL
jgi:predicted dehydrogenase